MTRFRSQIQTLMALGTNATCIPLRGVGNLSGSLKGRVQSGAHCYSCPGRAVLSVGAFQIYGSLRFSTDLSLTGAIVLGYSGLHRHSGRPDDCAGCALRFIQDLIHKLPTAKFSMWKPLRW